MKIKLGGNDGFATLTYRSMNHAIRMLKITKIFNSLYVELEPLERKNLGGTPIFFRRNIGNSVVGGVKGSVNLGKISMVKIRGVFK